MSFILLIKSHKSFNKEREEEKGCRVKNMPRRVKNINRHTDICRYINKEQNSLSGWLMEENKGKRHRPSNDFPLVLWPCALKCLKISFFQDYYFSLCFSLASVCACGKGQWSGRGYNEMALAKRFLESLLIWGSMDYVKDHSGWGKKQDNLLSPRLIQFSW